MKKKTVKAKSTGIDTMRLRILQTKCLTVREIAKKMGTTPTIVEYELRRMGYTPCYDKDKPEPDKLLSEIKKERAQADACTRPKGEK